MKSFSFEGFRYKDLERLSKWYVMRMRNHSFYHSVIELMEKKYGAEELLAEVQASMMEAQKEVSSLPKGENFFWTTHVMSKVALNIKRNYGLHYTEYQKENGVKSFFSFLSIDAHDIEWMFSRNVLQRSKRDLILEEILSYYEVTSFSQTCEKFDLTPTKEMKELFSMLCPKPEKAGRSGKWGEKTYISHDVHYKDIMQKYNVHKSTACRAKKKGYLYVQDSNKEKFIPFNSRRVMEQLLDTAYKDEILKSLKVSPSYSFYFVIKGVRCRVSNHARTPFDKRDSWQIMMDVDCDISPEKYQEFDVQEILSLFNS